MEGIKGYGGSSIPIFSSIVITALQRHRMPYRSGGHSTAAAIAALGGESNYIDEPRRRRPPPVLSPILNSPARPAQHLYPPTLRLPAPHLACRCLHSRPSAFTSSPRSTRVVAQDGTQPSRPLFDTVCAACTAWLAVAESGAWSSPSARINHCHLATAALPLTRTPFIVARPPSKASTSTLRISVSWFGRHREDLVAQRAKPTQDTEFIVGPNVTTGDAAPAGTGRPLGHAPLP